MTIHHKVLIVEDNPLNMELFCDVLEAAEFEIIKAEDAEAAYHMLETQIPDIILMDLQLPGKDGYTLIRELLANPTYKGIPILALTAYAMRGDQERAMAVGCKGIITKPVNVREFPNQVRQAILMNGSNSSENNG